MFQKSELWIINVLLCISLSERVMTDLTPEEEEALIEAREDDELMKIIVIEMIRDNDNCRDYWPWSLQNDGVYGPTEVHCNHACNLISDLYLMNGGGDNKTRITDGGRCKNSWTIFKRCMCRLKDHTMPKYRWRTLHFITKRYLGPVMVKYLNHTTYMPPVITIPDPNFTKDYLYRESTDPWKDFWH
nr:PREDICTED: uncharacterized protein LOC109038959 [Bemisia tabaci]